MKRALTLTPSRKQCSNDRGGFDVTRNQQIVVLACALLLASEGNASATLVTETVTTAILHNVNTTSSTSYTFSFSPIANADELVSISGTANVNDPEGSSTFKVELHYTDGTLQELASHAFGVGFGVFDLSTISNVVFPSGTIDELIFTGSGGGGGGLDILQLPAGTIFSFDAATVTTPPSVPEPAPIGPIGVGLLGLLGLRAAMRRKRGKSCP
jgi:hypothetical protein